MKILQDVCQQYSLSSLRQILFAAKDHAELLERYSNKVDAETFKRFSDELEYFVMFVSRNGRDD